MRVFQSRQELCFLQKLFKLFGRAHIGMQQVDCNCTFFEMHVFRFIYTAKSATSDFGGDSIVANQCPDEAIAVHGHIPLKYSVAQSFIAGCWLNRCSRHHSQKKMWKRDSYSR